MTAPINITPPVISGDLHVGNPLTTTDGDWSGSPTSFQYQWFRGTPQAFLVTLAGDVLIDSAGEALTAGSGVAIPGATAKTYITTNDDIGLVFVEVTATNSDGSSFSASDTVLIIPAVTQSDADIAIPRKKWKKHLEALAKQQEARFADDRRQQQVAIPPAQVSSPSMAPAIPEESPAAEYPAADEAEAATQIKPDDEEAIALLLAAEFGRIDEIMLEIERLLLETV